MEEIKVLDHGYVRLIESWGSDERIIEAARMSTNKGFLGWGPNPTEENCQNCYGRGEIPFWDFKTDSAAKCHPCNGTGKVLKAGDEKLLEYLYSNAHMTPFEMAGMIIEVQAPIFVFREWHRHRTQSYNEMSARYTPMPDLNYVPTVERLMINAGGTNKQAGTVAGSEVLTEEKAGWFIENLVTGYQVAEEDYQAALRMGVPKELARLMIPVGRYSRMRASANLRNWLGFETLRLPSNAQWEIRQYAEAVGVILKECFPRTWALFQKGRM